VEQGTSGDSSNLLTRYERSLSAEVEGLGDEEDNEHSLSDEEAYHPSSTATPGQTDESLDADHPPTWHDIALSIAASLMLKMRDEVKNRLGYTTSAVRMVDFQKNDHLRFTIL
jgi:hypothetical protein